MNRFTLLGDAALLLASVPGAAQAQGAATGRIAGRVFNSRTGQYLENARLSIDGTSLAVFTDAGGEYEFFEVPAGPIVLRASFTSMEARTEALALSSGETVRRDFDLGSASTAAGPVPGVVRLSQFVVGASKQMDAAAIAINEQRYAANIKTVIAADEFGSVVENDIGEILKFVPGITMDYNGGDARRISMDGVSSDYVPVTIGGFNLANANQNGTNRAAALDQVSLNNVSRIEVNQTPTPESPGSALAGSVNLVPRSAFERSKPLFTFSTVLAMRDNARDFHRSVGPRSNPTRKVLPGFDFSYVAPVNDRFGFSLSASAAKTYSPRDFMTNTWRGADTGTNGGTLPDTTADKPYLSDYLYRDGFIARTRTSIGLTLDYKLSRTDQVSFSLQRTTYVTDFDNRLTTFIVNRVLPGNFTPTSTTGFAGAGEVRVTLQTRARDAMTYMPSLVYRHHGPVWTAQAGAGYSHAGDGFHDVDKGYFSQTLARRTGGTVSFADITYLRPGKITVTDGVTGAPVDPYDIRSYALSAPQSQLITSSDVQRSVYANLKRNFKWGAWPGSVKTGVDLGNSIRDIRGNGLTLNYAVADGRTSTTPVGNDDAAVPFYDAAIATRPAPFGFPTAPVINHEQLLNFYRANPGHFSINENTTYVNTVNQSKRAEEVVYAGYVRGDLALLDQRLKLVGGIRGEQTNVNAEGPLTDPTRNYQRNAAGTIILGANGRPLPITTNALAVSQLTRLDRGAHVHKEYLRWFPSLNAAYNVRENLIARAGYYQSLGRPNLNQYAGGITLPDPDNTTSAVQTITVNNAGIKAWSAETLKLSLEYYFPGVGLLSAGAFRREFENFFGNTVLPATPEFLALYDLDAATYGSYQVATQYNIAGTVRTEGFNVNYKQALTFLPSWARGLQVFANGNIQRATGAQTGNFSFSPRFGNCGISLTRENYDMRVNWNYRGRQRQTAVNGRSIGAGTFNWSAARVYVDISAERTVWKRFAVFAKIRNLRDQTEVFENSGPLTPAHASLGQREDFAALWTFGIKGSF
jgi:TonB-dependent receptor